MVIVHWGNYIGHSKEPGAGLYWVGNVWFCLNQGLELEINLNASGKNHVQQIINMVEENDYVANFFFIFSLTP